MEIARTPVSRDRSSRIDHRLLRDVCGHFITGVTVITTLAEDGPLGATVNSFTSVSLDPPLVLFCIHGGSALWRALRRSAVFGVNILADDQAEVCRNFARRATASFGAAVRTRPGTTGAPIITNALAYLECVVVSQHPGGDHWIVVGEVRSLGVLRPAGPLTFFRSGHPRLEAVA
jgi:3-hydroxy-9,10-secoandrosta-1,3,5(10)-triene-9,17-dione monooxygenase reductase component